MEIVVADVECDELGQLGDEWSEGARVALRVECDLDDAVSGARDAAGEVGDSWDGAGIRGEVPRGKAGGGRDGGGHDGGFECAEGGGVGGEGG